MAVAPMGDNNPTQRVPSPTPSVARVAVQTAQDDYFSFGSHVKTDYCEVFMEPGIYNECSGCEECNCRNGCGKLLFDTGQSYMYNFLASVVGFALCPMWGLVFAANSVAIIWIVQPFLKITMMWLKVAAIIVRAVIRIGLDPVFESCAILFSRVGGDFRLDLRGMSDRFISTI